MADVIAEEQKQYDRRIHDSVTKNLSSVTENPPETVTKNYSAAPGPVSHSRASGAASALSLYASLLFDCASPTHLARCPHASPQPTSRQRGIPMLGNNREGEFKSAPEGSRHERMLWAARKIARLTGATEGGAYQMLLIALIEAERRLNPGEFNHCG